MDPIRDICFRRFPSGDKLVRDVNQDTTEDYASTFWRIFVRLLDDSYPLPPREVFWSSFEVYLGSEPAFQLFEIGVKTKIG